jgi:hypothetical protein
MGLLEVQVERSTKKSVVIGGYFLKPVKVTKI